MLQLMFLTFKKNSRNDCTPILPGNKLSLETLNHFPEASEDLQKRPVMFHSFPFKLACLVGEGEWNTGRLLVLWFVDLVDL